MGTNEGIKSNVALALALIVCFLYEVESRGRGLVENKPNAPPNVPIFDVTKFGAEGNGKPVYDEDTGEALNAIAFIQAWQKACHSKGPSKVLIPKGVFVVAQVIFSGPCTSKVTVEFDGYIIPDPDVSQFPNNELVVFQNVDGVTFTGSGIIDGHHQGQQHLDPGTHIDFFGLMPSIKLLKVTNSVVEGISSKNPSAFHLLIVESHNINVRNVAFNGGVLTPNTDSDGIYIASSSQITVSKSFIRTADSCITIAPGSSNVSISYVACAAGQGISIGSDAYNDAGLDVKGVRVSDCTFKQTKSGIRIFPTPNPNPSIISDLIFQNLMMTDVQNPILITDRARSSPKLRAIPATIRDVHFRHVKGTATTNHVTTILCTPNSPCKDFEMLDVNVKLIAPARLK